MPVVGGVQSHRRIQTFGGQPTRVTSSKYARLAQRERVETFAVGSELKSMVHEEARWRALIKAVRRDYEGQLVYSANWDNYTQVGFWDELDVIGLNGYFSLSRTYRPDLETLRSAWQIVRRRLMDWAGGLARPILLTEVGYRSSVVAPAEPWSHFDMPAAAPDVQLKCFGAFIAPGQQRVVCRGCMSGIGLGTAAWRSRGLPHMESRRLKSFVTGISIAEAGIQA